MQLIDSHCHIDFPQFDEDRKAVLSRAVQAGVSKIIVPGVRAVDWARQLGLCQQHPFLYPALGLHPYFLEDHLDVHLLQLDELLSRGGVVAVGEIGLDFYRDDLDRTRQERLFLEQLSLAENHQLPVILHVRKAHDQVIQHLRNYTLRGVVHAYSGSEQQARRYIELGYKLGVGGGITNERATRIREVVRGLPLESMVLETDAPDMPPATHRGERNEPSWIGEVAETVALLKGESFEAVVSVSTQTVEELFAI